MQRYSAADDSIDPATGLLRNKAGLTGQAEIDTFEAAVTTVRILEWDDAPGASSFDLAHLCAAHRHLFQDVYDWAGQIRNVDITRGNSRFANVNQIESYATKVFAGLKSEDFLRGLASDRLASRLAHYLSEINAMHPFRDGNGRVQRVFISQLASAAGFPWDYSAATREEMYAAMEAAFFGDEAPLARLIAQNLTAL